MKENWQKFLVWFGPWIRNGGKLQIAISILIFGGVVALLLQFHSEFSPKNRAIEIVGVSVQAPVQAGRPMVISRSVCNHSNKKIDVVYSLHLLRQDPEIGESEITIPGQFSATVKPGCEVPPPTNTTIPASATPGQYELRLIAEYTPPGGFVALVSGTSAPFEIEGR